MELPDLEIVVSRDPNGYMLEPDGGRELQILDRIIAAKDRETSENPHWFPAVVGYRNGSHMTDRML